MKAPETKLLDLLAKASQFCHPDLSPPLPRSSPPARRRIEANHAYFKAQLQRPTVDLGAICRGLAKLVVVDIRLDRSQDNPQLRADGSRAGRAGISVREVPSRIPTNSHNTTCATFSKNYRSFPTDDEFREALKSADLYRFKRRSYFLRHLENHQRKGHVAIEDYTIEHILPQNENLSAEWRQALGDDWADVQARYLHTLGNLTLTGYNSEYSDHPFAVKRDMEGGFKDSPLRLNKGLGQLAEWNAAAIQSRAERLAEVASTIWARPILSDEVRAQFEEPWQETGFSIEDHPNLLPPAGENSRSAARRTQARLGCHRPGALVERQRRGRTRRGVGLPLRHGFGATGLRIPARRRLTRAAGLSMPESAWPSRRLAPTVRPAPPGSQTASGR
ncbi:hypothetical protein GCM10009804_56630 [Kribbella hippodromi]|uniref:GmrSD restriction endonucleases C-terminal domain-containing protein n=1 Tax=Kribbella hippodromi TaxID=434347 RepID=A0ABP4PYT8_9ACTN